MRAQKRAILDTDSNAKEEHPKGEKEYSQAKCNFGMTRILLIGRDACRTSLLNLTRLSFSEAEIVKAGSLPEGISHINRNRFDLVLADIDAFGPRALNTLRSITSSHPAIRIAVMSMWSSHERISASLAGGMHGFVSKLQSDEDILSAMKEILSGGVYIPGLSSGDQVISLTPRQKQVLRLLSLGMSNKEIARALGIAEATTKIHLGMLMRALGVRNRTEAALKAAKLLSAT